MHMTAKIPFFLPFFPEDPDLERGLSQMHQTGNSKTDMQRPFRIFASHILDIQSGHTINAIFNPP